MLINRETQEAVTFVLGSVAAGMTIYMLWRVIAGPDQTRILKMKLAKNVETVCMRNAALWADAADMCARTYDGSRAVTL